MNISRPLLALALIATAAAPAIAQQFAVTAEVAVSDPHPVAIAAYDPVIVATNDGFIDIWSSLTGLRATRLTRDGLKADAFGIPLSTGKVFPPSSRPAVIFNGRTVVVFWNYFDVIYVTELTPDLEILQQDRAIATVGGSVDGAVPSVAWDGARYLVLAGSHRIVLDSALHVVLDGARTDNLFHERLASDGSTFVLVGNDTAGQIVAQQLLPDGTPSGDRLVLDDNDNVGDAYYRGQASIAGSLSGYVVAWNRGSLELARITVPLRMIARGEVPAGVGGESIAPNVAWMGSSVIASWMTKDDPADPYSYAASLLSATFPADLGAVPAAGQRMAAVQWNLSAALSLATLGGTAYVTWADNPVKVQRVGASGDPIVISNASMPQTTPVVARSMNAAAAVWLENQNWSSVAARLTAAGTLDPDGIAIGTTAAMAAPSPLTVAIASDGSNFLVVSVDLPDPGKSWEMSARVLRADGRAGASVEVATVFLARQPIAVEWDGDEYVVVWTEPQRIGIVRLNRDGGVVARQEIKTTALAGPAAGPALACSDGECVVAWTIAASCGACSTNLVEAARLDRYSVVDQMPVLIATSPHGIEDVFVAKNGDDALVTWTDIVSVVPILVVKSEVRGARFGGGAPEGTAPTDDGFAIAVGTKVPRLAGIRPYAGGFALLWQEWGLGLFLTRLDSNGTADPATTTNVAPGATFFDASLGNPAAGRIPIVYQRQTTDAFFGWSQRVFFREAFLSPPRMRAVRVR